MLLEVLMAVAIVAISLWALVENLNRCLAAARSIQSYTISSTLLANKSYEFRVERAQDYDNAEGRFEDYPNYTWERRLELSSVDNLWIQTITVTWPERGGTASESVYEYRYLPDKQ